MIINFNTGQVKTGKGTDVLIEDFAGGFDIMTNIGQYTILERDSGFFVFDADGKPLIQVKEDVIWVQPDLNREVKRE